MEEVEGVETGHVLNLAQFKQQLQEAFKDAKGQKEIWTDIIERITAFGPRRVGPNILIDTTSGGICGKAYVSPPVSSPATAIYS
jgi:ribosome assembly protein 1